MKSFYIIDIINLNKYYFFNQSISIKFKKEAYTSYVFLLNKTLFVQNKNVKKEKKYRLGIIDLILYSFSGIKLIIIIIIMY